jgi:soluble lytic murein transglycosylase-like protein
VRTPRLRGLLGAGVAVAAWAAVAAFPVALGVEPRVTHVEAREPGPPGLVDGIDARIAERIPALDRLERRRLARAIVEEAEGVRLDPFLVLAVIEVESAFDPRALSGAGARGLMQLRDATMRREVARSRLTPGDPHDPVLNVQAGVRYLRRCLDAFPREDVGLMAYNAGPNLILSHLRNGGIPEPFHVYPRRVNAELRRLRRAFAAPPPALADARRTFRPVAE